MQQNTLARRLDLLKMEGDGLLRPEIVKELSDKYECSKDALWYDFRTKPKWQPYIQELKNVYLRIINRHDQLYRKAAFQYIQVSKSDAKSSILALNLMRNLNRDMYDFAKSTGYQPSTVKPPKPRGLEWVDPPEWQQKQYQSDIDHTQDKATSTSTEPDSESSHVDDDGAKPKLAQTKPSANS